MGSLARVAVPALMVAAAGATIYATAGAATPAVAAGYASLGATAVSGLAATYAAQRGAEAQKASAKYEAQAARRNAQLADLEAADALERGADAEARHRLQVAQLAGRQRNAFAANGVSLDSESVLDTLGDTAALGELDAMTIRLNAQREAWGSQAAAGGWRGQGAMSAAEASANAPWVAGGATLLTSAAEFSDRWYRQRRG